MKPQRIVLIGGSGFVGEAVAAQLAAAGRSVLVPTRNRERARNIILLPTIEAVQADVYDPATLASLLTGADAVVNLVGVLHSRRGSPYGPGFKKAHVELPQLIVDACKQAGVERLVHISALGADAAGPSEYQRSKAAGEEVIRNSGLRWIILRPSVIFGRNDSFINLFASLAGVAPVLPLACPDARFQPVYVGDVAEVVQRSLDDPLAGGDTHEVTGPSVYTLRELVDYAATLSGHPRRIIGLPNSLASLQAFAFEFLPNPPMTRDNLASMSRDNVASGTPLPYGLTPTPIESVVPTYLGGNFPRARYYGMRAHARRDV